MVHSYDVAGPPPVGFILRLVLQSTCGDNHYIGLNGIELFDTSGRLCDLRRRVAACPGVVSHSDVRTPSKLADGVNATWDDSHSECPAVVVLGVPLILFATCKAQWCCGIFLC